MSISFVQDGAVALVTMARPEKLNALDRADTIALRDAMQSATEDPEIRAIVLTGAGVGFCAGGDMSEDVAGRFAHLEQEIEWTRQHAMVSAMLQSSSKPSIAAVNGACAGFGMSLALACDLRFAADSAVFVTAYARVGLPGDGGIGWNLGRLVGVGRARELMMLSPKLTAAEALQIGLVNRTIPSAELMAVSLDTAHNLAEIGECAMAAIKANAIDAEICDLSTYIERETARHVACKRSSNG